MAENIAQKMTFGDAILLQEAEKYRVEALVTWHTKDFLHRTRLSILTPAYYLDEQA